MTVTWVHAELPAEDGRAHWSPLGKDTWQPVKTTTVPYSSVAPEEGLLVYRAEVTGLAPGARYQLRIGGAHRFQTIPAKATNTFQFVSGGDSGAGKAAIANNILAARQIRCSCSWAATSPTMTARAHRLTCASCSQKRLIPIVSAIGNHEVASVATSDDKKRRVAPFFQSLYGGFFAETT